MSRIFEPATKRNWLPTGTVVRSYVIHERIAATGTGEVYRATDRIGRREVALKLLPVPPGCNAEQTHALARQIKLQAPPRHPHICELYETGVTETGQLFVAAELVAGQSLDVLAQAGAKLDVPLIAAQIAAALHAAHARGQLHGDLKLSDLMLTHTGDVKVLDFGLGVFKPLWQPLGKNGIPLAHTLPSSIRHFTPEHINRIPFSPQSDLFSLGTILYELLTGHAAFSGASLYEICAAITCDTPTPLPATAPQALRTVISQLLEKDLTQRIPTAYALLEALRPACHTANTSAGTPARAGSNTDWQLVGALGKGALQQVFDTSPFAVGWCLAVGGMLYVLSSLTMLFGNKH